MTKVIKWFDHPLAKTARDTFHAMRKQLQVDVYDNFTRAEKKEFVLHFYNPLRHLENELRSLPTTDPVSNQVRFYVENILFVCNKDIQIATSELENDEKAIRRNSNCFSNYRSCL